LCDRLLDISKDTSVREAAALISSLTGELDVIINNAAILGDITSTIEDPIDFGEIEKVFGVNAVGPLRVSNALLGLLLKGSNKLIVNISSEAGSLEQSYRTSWFPYCMSKAALNMQSIMIHTQLLPQGGQVILIHPEWMQTYMRGERDNAASHTAEESARRIRHIIENHRDFLADKPAYINTRGEPLPW
jgi:NAD(P)-dependent dehydrogenase (short-subunit alcohol dehydrogenase family)